MAIKNSINSAVYIDYELCKEKHHVVAHIMRTEESDILSEQYIEQEVMEKLSIPDYPLAVYADYQTASVRADLLLDFMAVQDADDLLLYLRKRGIPDFDWSTPVDDKFYFSVERFLAASATLNWLFIFIEAVQNESYEQLKNWLNTERKGSSINAGFNPTALDKQGLLKHWKGIQMLTNEDCEQRINLIVQASIWDENPRLITMDCAKMYLTIWLNKLVENIRLKISSCQKKSIFTPTMNCSTPYQAICLALYEKATGSSAIGHCNNPHCPRPFYVVSGNTKRRKDRGYCDRPGCQKYCYNHPELGFGRSKKRQNQHN